MSDKQKQGNDDQVKPVIDSTLVTPRPVPVISPEEFMAPFEGEGGEIKITKIQPGLRETLAYKILRGIGWYLGGVSGATFLTFLVLAVKAPKDAAANLDLCLKLFTTMVTTPGVPAIFTSVLGYLFGRQEVDLNKET